MGNPEHVDRLRQGVRSWNDWRLRNPGTKPDLLLVDLSGQNLSYVDFRGGNLSGATFGDFLVGAHFDHADLRGASLIQTDLRGTELSGSKVYGISVWDVKLDEDDT